MTKPRKQRIYAIYDDDKFVDVGTKEELSARLGIKKATIEQLSARLGIKKATIEQYMTKSYQARPSSKRIAIFVGVEEIEF
ncbi:TPA: hypothetical protein ACJOEE_000170 [Streptococcus agalactiae]